MSYFPFMVNCTSYCFINYSGFERKERK